MEKRPDVWKRDLAHVKGELSLLAYLGYAKDKSISRDKRDLLGIERDPMYVKRDLRIQAYLRTNRRQGHRASS